MPFDPEMAEILKAQMITNAERSSQRCNIAGENAMQALTVVQNTVIQAQASNTDDAGLIAALATASRTPQSGALPAVGP